MRHCGWGEGIWPTTVSQESLAWSAGLQDCRSCDANCLPYSNIRIRISRHCTFWLLFIYSQRKNVCYARDVLSLWFSISVCVWCYPRVCVCLVGFRLSKPHTPGRSTNTHIPTHSHGSQTNLIHDGMPELSIFDCCRIRAVLLALLHPG